MINEFIEYFRTLDGMGICPGIRNRKVYVCPGTDPRTDCDRAVTFRRAFGYDAIVYYYPSTDSDLDAITSEYNAQSGSTDSFCLYMDPDTDADPDIPQPPCSCIIIQSYSELQNMRQLWQAKHPAG